MITPTTGRMVYWLIKVCITMRNLIMVKYDSNRKSFSLVGLYTIKIIYVVSLFIVTFFSNCKPTEERQIKNVCISYIYARIALDSGDTTAIKSVTEDSLYKLIMLKKRYIDIIDAPVIGPDLNIKPVSVKINGNSAICKMSGTEYYHINLIKRASTWRVKGENDIYPTVELILNAKKKLSDQRNFLRNKPAQDSVLFVINAFSYNVKNYFKSQESIRLKRICDDAAIHIIRQLYDFVKKKGDMDMLFEEMEKFTSTVGDVKFTNNKIIFKFQHEDVSINLQKKNNSYIISGFNGVSADSIKKSDIEKDYFKLLRSFRLIRAKSYQNKTIR